MKRKFQNLCIGTATIVGLCMPLVGCNTNPNFTYTGLVDSYEPDYEMFPSDETIGIHQTPKIYMDNKNSKHMLCQDIVNTLNSMYKPFDLSIKYRYYVEIHEIEEVQDDAYRFSYYFSVHAQNEYNGWVKVLEAEVKNVYYSIFKDPFEDTNKRDFDVYFSPNQIHVTDGIVYVEKEFWLDTEFEIILNEWDITGKPKPWHIWSYKTTEETEQIEFEMNYAVYFIMYPHYFLNASIDPH